MMRAPPEIEGLVERFMTQIYPDNTYIGMVKDGCGHWIERTTLTALQAENKRLRAEAKAERLVLKALK